jgi:hypothetical protein
MNLAPNSPAMTAVDFHAPLMGPVPRVSAWDLLLRALRHTVTCLADLGSAVHNLDWLPLAGNAGVYAQYAVYLLLVGLGGRALMKAETGAAGLLMPVFSAIYLAAVALWPMDDPRLLMPLMPMASAYILSGIYGLGRSPLLTRGRAGAERAIQGTLLAVALALLISNVGRDLKYQRWCAQLPTVEWRPGFRVRFTSREAYDSFRLLRWAAENTEPEAVLMYHSSPPCRLISGRVCSPIPFTEDLARVRDYVVAEGIDYLVMDEWGRVFPGGAGWFTENVLRPMTRAFPADFEEAYRIQERESYVLRVKQE